MYMVPRKYMDRSAKPTIASGSEADSYLRLIDFCITQL